MEQRIIELEFYVITKKLIRTTQNADFLSALIDGLRFLVEFDPLIVNAYMNKFSVEPEYIPYAGELVAILYNNSELPIRDVVRAAGIGNGRMYKLIEEYNDQKYESRCVIPKSDFVHIKHFLEAYKKLKELI